MYNVLHATESSQALDMCERGGSIPELAVDKTDKTGEEVVASLSGMVET